MIKNTNSEMFGASRVRRIGKVMRDFDDSTAEEQAALSELNTWRILHLKPMKLCYDNVTQEALIIDSGALTSQRLKRLPSIISKLQRFPEMNLYQMRDIGGVRAICSDIDSVYRLRDKLLELDPNVQVIDYINNPRSSGYRGIHLVQTFDINGNKMLIEIQLRTYIQHLWATSVETIDALCGTALKSGLDNNKWSAFFNYVSNIFALSEGCNTQQEYLGHTIEDIINSLRIFDSTNHLIDTIRMYAKTSSQIIKNDTLDKDSYLVLSLQDNSSTRVSTFSSEEQALRKYLHLESHSSHRHANIVMVSVNNIKKLQQTYPNYFLNLMDFCDYLNAIFEVY